MGTRIKKPPMQLRAALVRELLEEGNTEEALVEATKLQELIEQLPGE